MIKRILVADDDPAIVESVKMLLEDEGYDVETTVNGGTVTDARVELPDVILLDIWMSGQDGRTICQTLKSGASTKDIPVIMISANRDARELARAAGADDFIAKPFDADFLLEKIAKFA